LNIIDVITEGFNLVTKKLWLAIVPILLDLFLWLGPKISIAPVINQVLAVFDQNLKAVEAMGAQDANVTQMMTTMAETVRETADQANFMMLLAWGRLGLPSIAGLKPINAATDRIIEITSYGQMLLAQVALLAIGLFIACLFLGMIGQEVRGEGFRLGQLLHKAPRYWLYMVALFVPLGMALITAFSISVFLGPFAILIFVVLLWVLIYFSFVPQAITLAEQKPLAALWSSFTFMRYNFWPAIGLLILVNVIGGGLSLIWQRLLSGSTMGMVVAIIANAYVGTALAAAAFIFYRERVIAWQKALQQQRQQ